MHGSTRRCRRSRPGGPDAVRIEALAAYLGVSKGGFYWHFTDRQALLTEMLDSWEKSGTDGHHRAASRASRPIHWGKLKRLFELTPSPEVAP